MCAKVCQMCVIFDGWGEHPFGKFRTSSIFPRGAGGEVKVFGQLMQRISEVALQLGPYILCVTKCIESVTLQWPGLLGAPRGQGVSGHELPVSPLYLHRAEGESRRSARDGSIIALMFDMSQDAASRANPPTY